MNYSFSPPLGASRHLFFIVPKKKLTFTTKGHENESISLLHKTREPENYIYNGK